MSSTEEKKIRQFFEKKLTPAAKALKDRAIEFLSEGDDAGQESYWKSAPDPETDLMTIDGERFAEILAARWNREELPELAALAEPLMKLAEDLEITQEPSEEVSPFVYVMY